MARSQARVFRNERVSSPDMRIGRELLTGMGWAGTLGAVALCTLMFLFTYVAFEAPRKSDHVTKLSSPPEGRAALGRAPGKALQRLDRANPSRTRRSVSNPRSTHPLSGPSGGGDGLGP